MKTHRFLGNFQIKKPGDFMEIREPELVGQIRTVLRLKPGEEIIIGDGALHEARVRILEIKKGAIKGEIVAAGRNANEADAQVTLYCSILKRENFELVVQKGTEIGVRSIVPLLASRTVKLNVPANRLRKIAQEAAEQSGRGIIPTIGDPLTFLEALGEAAKNNRNILFDGEAEHAFRAPQGTRRGIFIGPEGGWTREELMEARESGIEIASLGPRTLRAETAAIVASYLAVTQ